MKNNNEKILTNFYRKERIVKKKGLMLIIAVLLISSTQLRSYKRRWDPIGDAYKREVERILSNLPPYKKLADELTRLQEQYNARYEELNRELREKGVSREERRKRIGYRRMGPGFYLAEGYDPVSYDPQLAKLAERITELRRKLEEEKAKIEKVDPNSPSFDPKLKGIREDRKRWEELEKQRGGKMRKI